MGSAPKRRDLEELWRERLKDAKLRLEFAYNYVKEVQKDLEAGGVPAPDGNFAFARAIKAENFALAEYNRVLRIFGDLLVQGKIPDERH